MNDTPDPEELGKLLDVPEPFKQPHRRRGWPKGKPRQARPRRPKLTDPAPDAPNEFAGMTGTGLDGGPCPDACRNGTCYITGANVCGHPKKGSNQFPNNALVCEQRARAARYLEYLKLEAR